MKTRIIAALVIVAAMVSCSEKKATQESETPEAVQSENVANANIKGRWNIENIVVSDSVSVRPAEAVPGSDQYINFDDSTYFIQTNCNTMSGWYVVNGDSIVIGDGIMTEIACDNMATEDALRQMLHEIRTVSFEGDSLARLNSEDSQKYMLLSKAAAE